MPSKPSIPLQCEQCDATYLAVKSMIDWNSRNHPDKKNFCSRDCHTAWKRNHPECVSPETRAARAKYPEVLRTGMKTCAKCGETKTVAEFGRDSNRGDGLKPYCRLCRNDESDSELSKARSRRWLYGKYGITEQDYEEMWQAQNGVCAICFQPSQNGKPLYVDHDHETGQVRGLLCHFHNSMLGYANDSIDILLSAIEYLKENADESGVRRGWLPRRKSA